MESANDQDTTRELKKAEEVGCLDVPTGRDAAKSLELRKQPLDAPASLIPAELAPILRSPAWTLSATLGCDQVDLALILESLLKHGRVPGSVAD